VPPDAAILLFTSFKHDWMKSTFFVLSAIRASFRFLYAFRTAFVGGSLFPVDAFASRMAPLRISGSALNLALFFIRLRHRFVYRRLPVPSAFLRHAFVHQLNFLLGLECLVKMPLQNTLGSCVFHCFKDSDCGETSICQVGASSKLGYCT